MPSDRSKRVSDARARIANNASRARTVIMQRAIGEFEVEPPQQIDVELDVLAAALYAVWQVLEAVQPNEQLAYALLNQLPSGSDDSMRVEKILEDFAFVKAVVSKARGK